MSDPRIHLIEKALAATTLTERLDQLQKEYGTLRKAAKALNISAPYLSRLRTKTSENPSPEILNKLGLRKVTYYYPSRSWGK